MREQTGEVEAEGQIKGPARRAVGSQSARGLAAAPREGVRVPRTGRMPQRRGRCRVPSTMHCDTPRQRFCRGQPR